MGDVFGKMSFQGLWKRLLVPSRAGWSFLWAEFMPLKKIPLGSKMVHHDVLGRQPVLECRRTGVSGQQARKAWFGICRSRGVCVWKTRRGSSGNAQAALFAPSLLVSLEGVGQRAGVCGESAPNPLPASALFSSTQRVVPRASGKEGRGEGQSLVPHVSGGSAGCRHPRPPQPCPGAHTLSQCLQHERLAVGSVVFTWVTRAVPRGAQVVWGG